MDIPVVKETENAGKSKKTDSCGCAMGARVMTAAFIISAVIYGRQFNHGGLTVAGLVLKIIIATFAGAAAGKLAGIGIYHLRKYRTL